MGKGASPYLVLITKEKFKMITGVIVVIMVLAAVGLWLIVDETHDDEYGIKR